MAIIGYTSGGSPIYMSSPARKSGSGSGGIKNKRFRCGCGASTTKNQLKSNGGVCHQCKQPMRT